MNWVRAKLFAEVWYPLDPNDLHAPKEAIRFKYGSRMHELLKVETRRSLNEDRLAMTILVDGNEERV